MPDPTWTCPTCGLVYPTQEDMKLHAVGHQPAQKYTDWGDDWVERCDNLMDQNEKLEHDLSLRWDERNEALAALRKLAAEYEKVAEIAQAAGFRSRYDQSLAYVQAKKLLAAHNDGGDA